MSPALGLHFAAIFVSFSLRVAAVFCVCWLLDRLFRKPQHRFALWLTFLLGSAAYWVTIIGKELYSWQVSSVAHVEAFSSAGPSATHALLLPVAWSQVVPMAVKAFAFGYLLIACALVIKALVGYLRLELLLRRGTHPSPELSTMFGQLAQEAGVGRSTLLILRGLRSPSTAGWWKPRVLLPEACEQLGPTAQVGDALCHELVHVRRHDYFWSGLANFICSILFFHPVIWMARKRMALQAELACDEAAVAVRSGDRADYAESLTYFVRLRMLQEGISLGIDLAASPSLTIRIRNILAGPQHLPWWNRASRAAGSLGATAALVVIVPVLAVSLEFSGPQSGQNSVQFQKQPAESRSHMPHPKHAQATPPHYEDSLTSLRVQPYRPDSQPYTFQPHIAGVGGESDISSSEGPAWKESGPGVHKPNISSVVVSTVGAIGSATRGHGRDKDDH
jgi:beta-lactamase regulating signal transducer with metallopeptidase domain